ncbi:putative Reverse transcriptase, LTR Retrotransposon, partial [Pseudoloma neurophilia]
GKKIEQEALRMESEKYIRASKSTWNNRIRPVDKPDGSVRICLDLMALNQITEKDVEKMPEIENILEKH